MGLGMAVAASAVLGLLLALAILARTGLRGRWPLFFGGTFAGAMVGLTSLLWPANAGPGLFLLDSLALELVVDGLLRALTMSLLLSGIVLLLVWSLRHARRSADLLAAAVGCGLGLGVGTTVLALRFEPAWPPSLVIFAFTNPPFQVGFGLLVGMALAAGREGSSEARLIACARHLLAILLQALYQIIVLAMRTIGHWLAWIEPVMIAILWLALIALFWAMGLLVMRGGRRSEPPAAFRPRPGGREGPLILRPAFWYGAAAIVILPALVLLVTGTLLGEGDLPLAQLMVLVVVTSVVMVGLVLWRTGLALARWRAHRPHPPAEGSGARRRELVE